MVAELADLDVATFATVADEVQAARSGAGVLTRAGRALLRVGGTERGTWLQNLCTNHMTALEAGQGVYTFACDRKGRIQFDANVLATEDALLLDMDAGRLETAQQYLDRFLIMEDVQLATEAERARLGLIGPRAFEIAQAVGSRLGEEAPALAHEAFAWEAAEVRVIRHDFIGMTGIEFDLPPIAGRTFWERLIEAGAVPVGRDAAEVLRIEAGVPLWGLDIDEETLPAETGQLERAVHFAKGCYTGHEIIERMRSRGVVSKRLRRLEIDGAERIETPAELHAGERVVGRVTSAARRPEGVGWVALGYVATSVSEDVGIVVGDSRGLARRVKVLGDSRTGQ